MPVQRPSLTVLRSLSLPLFSALLLAGCGGGGGSTTVATAPAASNVQITSANADNVAASAYLSANSNAGYNKLGTSVTTSATALSSQGLSHILAASNTPRIAAATISVGCPQGGTESFTVNDTNGNKILDTGDSIAVGFANCKGSDGVTVNGSVVFALNSLSGSFSNGTGRAGFSIQLASLTTSDSVDVFIGDGTLSFSLTQSGSQSSAVHSTTSGFAVSASNTSGSVLRSVTVQSGTTDITAANSTLTVSLSQAGTITSSSVNGPYALTTEIPLTYSLSGGDGTPTGGKLKISGTKSTLWITFLGNGNVQLDLDETGDGKITLTKTVKLSDLRKL